MVSKQNTSKLKKVVRGLKKASKSHLKQAKTSKDKKNPDRCLPRAKANSLSKKERAATARKKKQSKKTVVKNTKAAVVRASTGGFAVRGRGVTSPNKKTRCVVK